MFSFVFLASSVNQPRDGKISVENYDAYAAKMGEFNTRCWSYGRKRTLHNYHQVFKYTLESLIVICLSCVSGFSSPSTSTSSYTWRGWFVVNACRLRTNQRPLRFSLPSYPKKRQVDRTDGRRRRDRSAHYKNRIVRTDEAS